MRWLRLVLARFHALVRRNVVTDEIRDEMRFHVEMRTEEYEQRGLNADAARRAALHRFGNPALMQDRGYDVRGGGVMETVLQDVRFGVRLLWKQRAFSLVAILTLALGIGMSTALFTVIDAALLRPLPYPNPEQLVTIGVQVSDGAERTMEIGPSMDDIRTWRARSEVFSQVGMGRVTGFMPLIVDTGRPDRLTVAEASEGFLDAYGIRPVLGRSIQIEDTRQGAPRVGLLGHAYWETHFASDPDVLGRMIRITDAPVTIVGVLPPGFYPETAVWEAKQFSAAFLAMRGSGTPVVGRLRPGVDLDRAARELDRITATSTTLGPVPTPAHVKLESLYDSETSGYGATIRMLSSAVGLILLIACVNVAGLLLARGATRHLELAIRASVGAGRARLVRQLLTEAMVLGLAGALLGLAFAWLALDALLSIIPLSLPPNSSATINMTVLGLTLAVSVAVAVVSGLLPALRLSRAGHNFGSSLAGSSQRVGVTLSRRAGQILIASEVALALILLSGSGLVVRSFARLVAEDIGFDPRGVLTMEVEPLDQTGAVRSSYYPALVAALRALPEVEAVGAIDWIGLGGGASHGSAKTETGARVSGPWRSVLPGYFEALGVRPLTGRLLAESDRMDGDSAVVINASAASAHFGATAVGHVLQTLGKAPRTLRIVGVVPNIRHGGPQGRIRPEVYALPVFESSGLDKTLAVVMRLRPGATVPPDRLRAAAESVGPRVLVGRIRPASDLIGEHTADPRHRTLLLSLLGASGLILALVGIFSMTAFAVARRTREIGIRMAFGAQAGDVVRSVIQGALWPVTIGLAVGLAITSYAMSVIEAFLYQTTPRDPATLATVVVVVGAAACVAAWIPARRATRVDPVTALRAE